MLEDTVLGRRFEWEIRHLLRHYFWIELAHIGEYQRMGVMDLAACTLVREVVLDLTTDEVAARRATAMSDPLFALEFAVRHPGPSSGPMTGGHLPSSPSRSTASYNALMFALPNPRAPRR